MTDEDIQRQRREIIQLRQRVAELEGDVIHLNGQVTRLQKQNRHFSARRMPRVAEPVGGGQSG